MVKKCYCSILMFRVIMCIVMISVICIHESERETVFRFLVEI